MCFNAPVSFITFLTGIYIAYEIWSRQADEAYQKNYDYWNALFIVSFILVQLWEGFIWLGFDLAKYFLVLTIGLQPIVQSFGNAYFNGQPLFYIPTIIGLLFLLFFSVPEKMGKGINGHLNWQMNTDKNTFFYLLFGVFYFVFMSIPLIWQVPFSRYGILVVYGVITLIWSFYNFNSSGEFSSMWCFLAIGYAFLAYLVNKKTVNDNPDRTYF